ncbi:MAG: hypothetical protein D6738_09700 [Acidobacteria bacterium]|nr:MAG: hypothetical protein D6738_09700 [Acidobacteriota bacterium]
MAPRSAVVSPPIFALLARYRRSFEAMRAWLDEADLPLDERAGIADAWQAEMVAWFRENGVCLACHRPLDRCSCE